MFSRLKSRSKNEASSFARSQAHYTHNSDEEAIDESIKPGFVRNSDDVSLDKFYVPIDSYEGRHRYDPKATWSTAEESALIRRLDVRVYLGMNTNDYNTGQTIFYVSFLAAELPSQLISKKLGPDNWIPIQMVSWSIVACCQSRLTGRATFFLTRSLLGIIEGGFIPDVILYLSYFYKSKELPIRLSFFWGAYGCTYIIGAFLAYGILHLRGHQGLAGWQWLFALEGSLTALIGIISWFYLPPSPYQTASFFRGKDGWFSEREEVILANRIIRDDPSKGDMHNRQAVNLSLLWQALKDYDMWPIYLLGFTWTIPNQCATAYLTLVLRSLDFNTFETNLLTVPAYVLFVLQLIFWTWLSEKINNRFLIILICQLYMFPLVVGLETLPAGAAYTWSRYVLNMMLVGFPYVHAIIVAMTSRNAGSVRTRTVGSALYNMCVQTSNIISSNIYRDHDKPLYRTGNAVLLALIAYNIILIVSAKLYYRSRNAQREKVWSGMSEAERARYLETTTDGGNKRLDFRFVH
ncbi:dTDP-4-amino-4,6-dideoxygalactose transaminase [Physcia stellaris]|nr:dTDP-4-amino-4,6-dideoxygalactose transaminase [Physcia stellaris]